MKHIKSITFKKEKDKLILDQLIGGILFGDIGWPILNNVIPFISYDIFACCSIRDWDVPESDLQCDHWTVVTGSGRIFAYQDIVSKSHSQTWDHVANFDLLQLHAVAITIITQGFSTGLLIDGALVRNLQKLVWELGLITYKKN